MSIPIVLSPTSSKLVVESTGQAMRRVFFPNLNGLRFWAALMVIISHFEDERLHRGLSIPFSLNVLYSIGQLGVTLFFVLSGFLITYLLLAEKEAFGRISFGAFYMRRVTRIWPLYYVVTLLGLFVLPRIGLFFDPRLTPHLQEHMGSQLLLRVFMMPNVAHVLLQVPYLTQCWSIGVEEQFYIIWPILIHVSHRYARNFLLLAGGIYVIYQLSWFLTAPSRHLLPVNELTTCVKNFLFLFRIQCMAIGGVFALVLYRNQTTILKRLTARPVQALVWGLLMLLIARGQSIPYVNHEVYSVLFGVVILNLALADSSIINLRYKVLDYLGRISYGLYMWHFMAITIGMWLTNLVLSVEGPLRHIISLLIVIAISIALSAASYRYLEAPFLQLKKRFTRIRSGS